MAVKPNYVVDGDLIRDEAGAIVYDSLDSPEQAADLCRLINSGVGPRWDVLGPAYDQFLLDGKLPTKAPRRKPAGHRKGWGPNK